MTSVIRAVNYEDERQAIELVELLDDYARDEMGGAEPLSESTKESLVANLAQVPNAFSFIAYVDNEPAGLINCFQAFSTFKSQPLVNIHDVTVREKYRGLGISQQLLDAVEQKAKERGCCKVTLEVLAGNEPAKRSYVKYGFSAYELVPEQGHATFWEKKITP